MADSICLAKQADLEAVAFSGTGRRLARAAYGLGFMANSTKTLIHVAAGLQDVGVALVVCSRDQVSFKFRLSLSGLVGRRGGNIPCKGF